MPEKYAQAHKQVEALTAANNKLNDYYMKKILNRDKINYSSSNKMKLLHKQNNIKENKVVSFHNCLQNHIRNGVPMQYDNNNKGSSNSTIASRVSMLGTFLSPPVLLHQNTENVN